MKKQVLKVVTQKYANYPSTTLMIVLPLYSNTRSSAGLLQIGHLKLQDANISVVYDSLMWPVAT